MKRGQKPCFQRQQPEHILILYSYQLPPTAVSTFVCKQICTLFCVSCLCHPAEDVCTCGAMYTGAQQVHLHDNGEAILGRFLM